MVLSHGTGVRIPVGVLCKFELILIWPRSCVAFFLQRIHVSPEEVCDGSVSE